jgi:hypothetical protein
MLKKHRERAEMSVALRDIEARMHADKLANAPKPSIAKTEAQKVGAFGAKLLACETLAEAKRLLGIA